MVEFQCHGGHIVAQQVIDELLMLGARIAMPGEFSKRAFLNGRIDLCEAEAIAALIESRSVDAAKMLARQLKGELGEFVLRVRGLLVEILAYVEVNIDYAEEDLPLGMIEDICNKLYHLNEELCKIYVSSKRRIGVMQGFKVAIIGKPNVGKSSLLNALLCYDRAITSDIAGTTRDTIEEELRIGTHLVRMVDTAGIREADDAIEKRGIERSISAIEESHIVLALFDSSRAYDEEDEKILALVREYSADKECLIVLNKSDLEQRFDVSRLLDFDFLRMSCKNESEKVIEALSLILDATVCEEGMMLTSSRQIDAVKKANDAIELSFGRLNEGELELFAFHVRDAIESISSISSAYENDEMLDAMFGAFCLGK